MGHVKITGTHMYNKYSASITKTPLCLADGSAGPAIALVGACISIICCK